MRLSLLCAHFSRQAQYFVYPSTIKSSWNTQLAICASRLAFVVAWCEVRNLMLLAQPSRHLVSLWRGANFDMACATLSALCACRIALVVARCKFYIARACLSQQFVRVGSLSLWCGANFDMARATLSALRVLDRSRCGTVLILADSLGSWNPGKEIFWVICNVLLWRSCKIFVVHHIWRSWPRSCRGPCCCTDPDHILSEEVLAWSCTGPYQKILWRSCWHPLRAPCMILLRDPGKILSKRSLHADLADAMS